MLNAQTNEPPMFAPSAYALCLGHCALSIGHWALGIGHWALGIGHWALELYRDPLVERRQVGQPEPSGNVVDPLFALGRLEVGQIPQFCEWRTRTAGEGHAIEPLTGATHRQPMANDAEDEVVRQDIRPGHQSKHAGRD